MSCNCGRSREVVTSVQVAADIEARRLADEQANAEIMAASVNNAVANASGANSGTNSGWYLAPE